MSNPRLYIGELPPDVTREEVEGLFSKHGPIKALDLKNSRDGKMSSFAFLEFEDARDAEDAIRARNGVEMSGTRIRVEMAKGGYVSASSRGPPKRSAFRVRVMGLPQSASWQVRSAWAA